MNFTSGPDRAFERLMQEKPGFDHYDSGGADAPEDWDYTLRNRLYFPKDDLCCRGRLPRRAGEIQVHEAER